MPNLKATLWEKYHYNVTIPENPNLRQIAMAISLEVHRQEHKTKFTGTPRTFPYILKCLQKTADFNFRVNLKGESKEAVCTECNGEGKIVIDVVDGGEEVGGVPIEGKCPKCNGRGKIVETKDRVKEAFDSANYLNSMSKPKVIKCPACRGGGWGEGLSKCPKCNGHGKIVERITYRVGDTFSNQLVIDIDSKDVHNIKDVKEFYEKLLGEKFRGFHTTMGKGVWLFGCVHYNSLDSFKFAHCKVLNPSLEQKDMKAYVNALMGLDKNKNDEFARATPEVIKNSGLYSGHGNFDIAFTYLSIKRERSTIRRSAKRPGDKVEELIIE